MCAMIKDDPHFRLRVPAEMRALIADSAKKNRRSMNAEIVARLQGSLEADAPAPAAHNREPTMQEILDSIRRIIREEREK